MSEELVTGHRMVGARSPKTLEEKQAEARKRNPPPEIVPAPKNEKIYKYQIKDRIRSQIREFLDEETLLKRGRCAKSRLQHMCEALFITACDRRSPMQVAAANALLDRGYGKPSTGDPDDPTSKSGLTVVYVDRTSLDSSIPVVEDGLSVKPTAPEFLDAEWSEGKDAQ